MVSDGERDAGTPWRTLVSEVAAALAEAGVETPQVDAELLVAHVLGVSRGEVAAAIIRGDHAAPSEQSALGDVLARRVAREPLQHITGTASFRRLTLSVGPGVFVPRFETEILAEIAVEALRATGEDAPIAVDLGSGSGAIALALSTEVPHARVYAVERSPDAARWTRQNIEQIDPSVTLVHADLADALVELDGQVAVVASNPPYIPDAAIPRDPEVQLYDPSAALYGGEDGLDVVRALSQRALRLLRPGGFLALEHGETQGGAVRAILAADGWRSAHTHPDLTLRDRVTTALRP